MKYLCLAYGDRKKMSALTKEQFEALKAKCQEHDAELRATGKVISAESLEWDAMTIRPTGGTPTVTDGPFVESKEQIGGVIIIEARDLMAEFADLPSGTEYTAGPDPHWQDRYPGW